MSKSLEGMVAVVTGGTQGIGFAIAEEFVQQGATVVLTGRDQGRLDEAVGKIGNKASGVRADAGTRHFQAFIGDSHLGTPSPPASHLAS